MEKRVERLDRDLNFIKEKATVMHYSSLQTPSLATCTAFITVLELMQMANSEWKLLMIHNHSSEHFFNRQSTTAVSRRRLFSGMSPLSISCLLVSSIHCFKSTHAHNAYSSYLTPLHQTAPSTFHLLTAASPPTLTTSFSPAHLTPLTPSL